MPEKARKAWRQTDTPLLARLDFIGLRHFIYGGDPEWVRRRYFMVMSLGIGLFCTIAACVSTALGRLSEAITRSIIDGYFGVIMVVVPGYILGAVWDKKNQLQSGATVSEVKEVVTEPERRTETTTKEIAPPKAFDPSEPE